MKQLLQALFVFLFLSLPATGCLEPPSSPLSPSPGPVETTLSDSYKFKFASDQDFEEARIASFEGELAIRGLELTPTAYAYMAQGKALVGIVASDVPIVHPNGVVEVPEGLDEAMAEYELNETDPRLPLAFRRLESRVAFGLFNPDLPTHRAMMKDYLEFQQRTPNPTSAMAIMATGDDDDSTPTGDDDDDDTPTSDDDDATGDDDDSSPTSVDLDGDGYDSDVDCDDADPNTNPGAVEICDLWDNDCDGEYDEGLLFSVWYADLDGDGFGSDDDFYETCDGAPAGYLATNGDCDDADPNTNPGAVEVCDLWDNDCDDDFDEGCLGDDDDSAGDDDDDDSAGDDDDDDSAGGDDDDDDDDSTSTGDDDDDSTSTGDDDDATGDDDDDDATGDDDDDSAGDDDDSTPTGDDDDSTPDATEDDCSDGIDNDGNGAIDCADSYCAGPPPVSDCVESIHCSDGIDNDLDGLIDLSDPDCNLEDTTVECEDGTDNDGDGDVDCEDSDCAETSACTCAADCYTVFTYTKTNIGAVTPDFVPGFCAPGGYSDAAYGGQPGYVRSTCDQEVSTNSTGYVEGDRYLGFTGCQIEGVAKIQCDWNDSTAAQCAVGSNDADRASCEATGLDTGELVLKAEASAEYGNLLYPLTDKNEGWASGNGTLKAAHWQTGDTKRVEGATEIGTVSPGIGCQLKEVEVECKLELTATSASPGCSIGGGFTCATLAAEEEVEQTWTSVIESVSSTAGSSGINYAAGGTNAVTIGGKGVSAEGQSYAANSYNPPHSAAGYHFVQRGEGSLDASAYVDVTLEQIDVLRDSPVENVTTSCTMVQPSNLPPGEMSIHIACGESLVVPSGGAP